MRSGAIGCPKRGKRGQLSASLPEALGSGIVWPSRRASSRVKRMWTTPVKLDDSRLRALLPELRKTSYEKGIQITIQAMQAQAGNA